MTDSFRVENGRLIFQNGVDCGAVYREVDGYYVWAPNDRQGSWEGPYLVAIGELLNKMNAEWDRDICEYFKGERNESEE